MSEAATPAEGADPSGLGGRFERAQDGEARIDRCMTYRIRLLETEEGWAVSCLDLPGCHSQLADPVLRRDQKAAGARARFLLFSVLLQQAFIQITQPFLAGAVPIELVDLAHQLVERHRLLDERAGVGIDLLHQR